MFSDRVYELYAEWEQAQEEGTPFDLEQYADAPEYGPLTELITLLRPTLQSGADSAPEYGPLTELITLLRPNSESGSDSTPEKPAETKRYRFTDFIAQGGMGEVWRGFDKRLERVVALKVLRKRLGVSAERFREEAKLVSRLSHPGIAAVHDTDELEDGRLFFVMKLVEGMNLEDFLSTQRSETPDISECLRIFRQICQAVGYAHAMTPPLIHRDIKPQNIMIGHFGDVYVMDWGIAKTVQSDKESGHPFAVDEGTDSGFSDDTPDQLSESQSFQQQPRMIAGVAMGAFDYRAPEQAQGLPNLVGPATDVFCLGGILCRMLTGLPTFSSREDATAGNTSAAIERLQSVDVDTGLAEIANRCLMSSIYERYLNANHLLEAIDHLEAVKVERLRLAEISEARRQTEFVERRRRRRWQFGLGLLAVALICIAFVANSRRQASEKQQADQREELARDAKTQVREAKLLHDLAAQRPLEISGFEMAAKAARQAVNSAKLVGDADALSNAVALQQQIESELADVPRNIRFMTDLAAAQLPPIPRRNRDTAQIETPRYELISHRYGQACRNRGFNFTFDTNFDEANRGLKELPKSLQPDIAAHVDQYWMSIAGATLESWPPDMTQRIQNSMALAKELDNDPGTSRSRDLIRQRIDGKPPSPIDSETRENLLTVDLSRTPPGHLLVMTLLVRFQNEGTLANQLVLRAARERPTDLILLTSAASRCEEAAVPDWRKASEYRRAMTSLDPKLALGLAYDLLHDCKSTEPELIIQHLHKIRSPSAESYNALGVCLSFQEDSRDEEKQMYLKALELQADFEPAQRNLVLLEVEISE